MSWCFSVSQITTPENAMKDYFSTDNFHNWIRPVAFEAWMVWFREAVREVGSRPSSRMSSYTASSFSRLVPFHLLFFHIVSESNLYDTRPPSRMSETADLSSDNERNLPRPSSRATSSAYSITESSPDVIIISDSDDDEDKIHQNSVVNRIVKIERKPEEIRQAIKREISFFFKFSESLVYYGLIISGSRSISPEIRFLSGSSAGIRKTSKGKAKSSESGPMKLTSKLTVDTITTITSLPSTWAVPRDNSATMVDLSALDRLPRKTNGDEYTIDAFIRAEVCLNSESGIHTEHTN